MTPLCQLKLGVGRGNSETFWASLERWVIRGNRLFKGAETFSRPGAKTARSFYGGRKRLPTKLW
jgi:hypothetical protein